jgi:calcineurin-like phosphoesterase family protein
MKLYIVSDLHLEVSNFKSHIASNDADAIILAGDIWTSDAGIRWARAIWPNHSILYVPGNHEYYRSDLDEANASMQEAAKENGVYFLNDVEVIIDGVRFLGCTLWTNFKLYGESLREECMLEGERFLNDFRLIRKDGGHFSAIDSVNLHNKSVAWLETKLKREKFDGPTVVVSHHAPSYASVVPRFAKDMLSACFASRLDHLLGYSELWVHGHMHDSLDYMQGRTRVICNPRGYTRYEGGEENHAFNPVLIVEVGRSA